MEKKGNRNTPNSSRASSGTDLKKSTDVTSNKQGLRTACRRREPSCGFSKTTEANRKPQPQRNGKAFDKRPKPRGFYETGAVSRNQEACLEESNEIEVGSIFSPGSKKQSLNHLLNFSFAPRESYQPENIGTKQNGKWLVTKKHKYNKERFLQANCQFIVNEEGDYSKYMSDPDVLVDWNLIEQVNVQVNDKPSCPICLYPPVAAKVTKCGHIYCWPCILHYLALSDKDWRKCPICYDAVKKDDLKSVIVIPHKTFHVNDSITFKLMKRQRGSLTAFPADTALQLKENIFNITDVVNKENGSSKLFSANKEDILKIIDRENDELDILIAEDAQCPEICFMEQAKQLLESRRKIVLEKCLPIKKCSMLLPDEICEAANINNDMTIMDTNFDSPKFSESERSAQAKFFYFYQAEDGQHIYLHAINAKMIEHSYGSLEFGPTLLRGKILEKECNSMTEDLRKKLRYLQHLPVTCQFEVAEIELGEPNIKKESLDHFKEQLEKRKKNRKRRESNEKRRENRINAEVNKKTGKYTPNLHLDSIDQFPDVKQSHDMYPEYLDHRQRTESESSKKSMSSDLSSSISTLSLESSQARPSFATMLACEKKPSWPALRTTTNQPSSTPVKLISVTGSKTPSAAVMIERRNSDPLELNDREPVPNFNKSFGDAVAEIMARCSEETDEVTEDPAISGKKKKKKAKQKLLFSTHRIFPGN